MENFTERVVRIERHLRQVVAEFVTHYHRERNHQGLENRLIETAPRRTRTAKWFAESD
jgi:hypothetical protein